MFWNDVDNGKKPIMACHVLCFLYPQKYTVSLNISKSVIQILSFFIDKQGVVAPVGDTR